MSKQKPYIFASLVCFLLFQGCGIKGPLYQTPSEPTQPSSQTEKNSRDVQLEA
ncbi:lipoprotein [Colwelliaceae bacterium 6471]